MTGLAGTLSRVADLLLPPGCLGCRGWMGPTGKERRYLCASCATKVRAPTPPICARCGIPLPPGEAAPGTECRVCEEWPTSLRTARSAAILAPPADDLVHALKYGGWSEVAEEMTRGMAPLLLRFDAGGRRLLVPVPTTRARIRRRGYNQALLLAESLARRGVGTVVSALRRIRESESQVTLHRDERATNVSGAFGAVPDALNGLGADDVIVLVDDVLTTGATASAAAGALEEVGVMAVHLVTYGRALPGREDGANAVLPPPGFI